MNLLKRRFADKSSTCCFGKPRRQLERASFRSDLQAHVLCHTYPPYLRVHFMFPANLVSERTLEFEQRLSFISYLTQRP